MAYIIVITTRPVMEYYQSLAGPIITDRPIMRSYQSSDLPAYRTILTQPEAVGGSNMSSGLAYTQDTLEGEFPPYQTEIYLGVWLKNADGSEGDLIGDGGIHHLRTDGEWPELSFRFKKEFWGSGYATEFVRSFMSFWRSLPRESVQLRVPCASACSLETSPVPERVYALVRKHNTASQKVLGKAWF
jgi:RimJ/RimL family protein N-acetyltransferase